MNDERLNPGALSDAQWELVREGMAEKMSQHDIWELVKEAGPANRDAVREACRVFRERNRTKTEAKREGAEIAQRFLERVKAGDEADVEEMSALIENALYRDILRRYAEKNEVMADISFERLLKLDLSYRKLRLARSVRGGEEESALLTRLAVSAAALAVDAMAASLSDHVAAPRLAEARETASATVAGRFGKEAVAAAEEEKNQLDRLRELSLRPVAVGGEGGSDGRVS
jgi:hypothetical protein